MLTRHHPALAAALGLAASLATSSPACATTLRVATWNLGWHISQAELGPWIAQCSKSFKKDESTDTWEVVPPQTAGARTGWSITEGRPKLEGVDLAVMPPCGVYRSPSREGIAVTPASWAKRNEQLARVLSQQVKADVIAFQEVAGTAAVREALGAAAAEYDICSFDGQYKIQRLAFAWRKSVASQVGSCQVFRELSLPQLPPRDQVRPGLALTLQIGSQRVRFLTVHLKSACVSPLERGRLDATSREDDPCPVLQQQIAPLESIIEGLPQGVDHVVVLGDFNRNLGHEAARVSGAEPVRSDGSSNLGLPRPPGVLSRNLLLEVNDGQPVASRLKLLEAACPGSPEVTSVCDAAKGRVLSPDERRLLGDRTGLGCRNAVGLVHTLVSESLSDKVTSTTKIPLGNLGRAMSARPPEHPEPLLAVSDHCPQVTDLKL
jgi:endonuclease/exonuclease/phosphatase family metal-dependent hydrolase